MKNPLSDVYPAVTNCGNLMNDDDLIDMVRKHMGDDVGLVLAHRLEIARPRLNWIRRSEKRGNPCQTPAMTLKSSLIILTSLIRRYDYER